MAHGAYTLEPPYACLQLALAAIRDFELWSYDVELASLQSTELLLRRVITKKLAPQFELETHEYFELLRPLLSM